MTIQTIELISGKPLRWTENDRESVREFYTDMRDTSKKADSSRDGVSCYNKENPPRPHIFPPQNRPFAPDATNLEDSEWTPQQNHSGAESGIWEHGNFGMANAPDQLMFNQSIP